jgi:superfamily II DNA or RNA helicase
MSDYPDVDDDDFYPFINKKYAKYKIPKEKKSLREICFPKKYEFQVPQKFLAEFINPKTPYKGILVYHRIGAGKTCTAVNIAEKFKKYRKIMVVLPASLKGNFRNELRSPCAGNKYITEAERDLLKKLHPSEQAYKDIIMKSDERINKFYTIYSYNKFVELIKEKKLKLNNTLLIIDEVHNMISETGTYYENLYNIIKKAPDDLRLVLMSATPIFDKPTEIALTMNLLLPKDRELPTGVDFINEFINTKYVDNQPVYSVKNMDLFKEYVKGYVSYYRGAPPHVFPKAELFFSRCKMSDIQYKLYKKVAASEKHSDVKDFLNVDISNSFFIGTRMISNFVYPNKKLGEEGYESLEDDDLSMAMIKEYSPKFFKIMRRIKKCEGTVFVYSNFKEFGGLKVFMRLLEHHHYRNYALHGSGTKRFAVWSGDEDIKYKEEIKAVFNNKNNADGSQIKIILGSSAIKEGVSLLRVAQVHLLEPYWNFSRLDQVIGRAIRFCSHKDMPLDKQIVQIYIYLAVHPKVGRSIDEKIMKMAIQKKLISGQFEKALKEAAVDCTLFKYANDLDIICEV